MEKIKTCPFCGAPGQLISRTFAKEYKSNDNIKLPQGAKLVHEYNYQVKCSRGGRIVYETRHKYVYEHRKYTVCCSNSHCIARSTSPDKADVDAAIQRWNVRKEG